MGGQQVLKDAEPASEGTLQVTHVLDRTVGEGQASSEARSAGADVRPVPDAASFREVFTRHAPYVLGLVRRLGVRDAEVEDVAQEVFIVVHRQLPLFEGRSSVKTWLCGITLRTVANHRRKVMRRREANFEASGELQIDADQDALLERRDDASTLQSALDRLSPKLREVFVLYEIEELPMADVARSLGCPRFTAYTRLHAARAALRQRLTQQGAALPYRTRKEGGKS
jgi:RNA polymerase sigma-70 factor, ECF subfamily